MRESCKGCAYYKLIFAANKDRCCHYALMTGELRGCEPDACTRYAKKAKKIVNYDLNEFLFYGDVNGY